MSQKILYIVSRIGGWDGIAMQAEIWIKELLKHKFNITLLTGKFETGYGLKNTFPYNKIEIITKKRLSLESQSELYEKGFQNKYNRQIILSYL